MVNYSVCLESRSELLREIDEAILGIDVDSQGFVVCLLFEGKNRIRRFRNCKSGFDELLVWLAKAGCNQILACMEATGRYGEELAERLHRSGNSVVVANPSLIAKHRGTLNQQNKTDPKDAEVIADYARCFASNLRLWEPLSEVHKQLRDVLGQIHILKKTRTAFSNRALSGLVDETVRQSTKNMIESVTEQIAEMEILRDKLFEQLPSLQRTREILDQVPGIGPEIADALAAKITFENFPSGRELSCFLGLSSSEWKSGKQKRRGKQKKTGDPHLRSLLRQGAVAAKRSKFFRKFVENLKRKGLQDKQIVGAVARKMLLIAHALVRNKQAFDPYYKHPLARAS